MSADLIDFEKRAGFIKNLAATRKLANEFVGPVSNKIDDHYTGGDVCEMDPTRYPDPPLADYVASAGYPKDSGEPIE